jgi:methionyl-tRNA synthetase
MVERYCGGIVPEPTESFVLEDRLLRLGERLPEAVARHLQAFEFDRALDAVWAFVAEANKYVSEAQPWALAKAAASSEVDAAAARARLHGCLFSLVSSLQTVSVCLAPMLPATSTELSRRLGLGGRCSWQRPQPMIVGNCTRTGAPLFPTQVKSQTETAASNDGS